MRSMTSGSGPVLGSTRGALLAILPLAVFALQACSPSPRGRVLVVGIDGASPKIVQPLLDRSALPNLQAIAERGVYGPLQSIPPLQSPPLWATIATGKTREEHGIRFFALTRGDGTLRLYSSSDRRVHAVWNILSEAGLSVGVVNWWNTFPVEKVTGMMVSDAFFPEEIAGRRELMGATGDDLELQRSLTVYPLTAVPRLRAVADRAGRRPAATVDPPTDERLPPWIDRDVLREVEVRDATVVELALTVESEIEPDVLMVFLPGIDRFSHWLWGAVAEAAELPPELRFSPSQRRAGRAALERYYQQTDRWIGRLLERYGPDDFVLVLSDHGFEAGQRLLSLSGSHESEEAELAVLFAGGPDIDRDAGAEGTTVLDITPAILAWLGLPVAEDMSGRIPSFVDVKPAETIATYDIGEIERLPASRTVADEELLEELRSLGYLE